MKRINKRNLKGIMLTIIVAIILIISIGYSAFNIGLNINDIKSEVRIKKDIRVTAISESQATNDASFNWEDYNVSSISGSVNLPNSNSMVKYKVEVTNIGNVEMGILSIKNEKFPENLYYSVEEYELKDKICNNGKCKLGVKKDFYITIKYRDGMYNSDRITYLFTLDFDFREFHKVTYKNISNTTSLPTEIIDGDDLEVRLDVYDVLLYENNLALIKKQDFTYDKGVLIRKNVMGDLIVEKKPNLYELIASKGTPDNIKSEYVVDSSGIKFNENASDTNGKGVYLLSGTEKKSYPTYYYRGDVNDNNVLFANYCWKIVRTTETGGVKLIFNGSPKEEDGKKVCVNIADKSQIDTKKYNEQLNTSNKYIPPAYLGYKYGDVYQQKYLRISNNFLFGNSIAYDDGVYTLENIQNTVDNNHHFTCGSNQTSCNEIKYCYFTSDGDQDESGTIVGCYYVDLSNGEMINDVIQKMFTNENDSLIKTYIEDEWYYKNMTSYTDKLEDTIWCNDKGIRGLAGWSPNEGSGTIGSLRNYMSFNPNAFNHALTCSSGYGFTVANKMLKYRVGMITADEVRLAGFGSTSKSNTTYYLYTGTSYWTLSPRDISPQHPDVWSVGSNGELVSVTPINSLGVRPMVSLKSNTEYASGTGFAEDPYVID